MTTLSHILMTATAVAPILVVYAARIGLENSALAAYLAGGAALCVLCCWGLFARAKKVLSHEPKTVTSVDGLEKESLAFLVAYALPVVSAAAAPDDFKAWLAGVLALTTFIFIMGLLVWQQQLFYVNPLAAILGYHFHLCRGAQGERVLVVSRTKTVAAGTLKVVVMSDYLWLHVP